MYNTFIPINHERITMNIENTPYGLKLGSEYGEYLLIRNDIYTVFSNLKNYKNAID